MLKNKSTINVIYLKGLLWDRTGRSTTMSAAIMKAAEKELLSMGFIPKGILDARAKELSKREKKRLENIQKRERIKDFLSSPPNIIEYIRFPSAGAEEVCCG